MSVIKKSQRSTQNAFPKRIVRNFTWRHHFFFMNSNALIGVLSEKQKDSDRAVVFHTENCAVRPGIYK